MKADKNKQAGEAIEHYQGAEKQVQLLLQCR